jgi:hypothetical protein
MEVNISGVNLRDGELLDWKNAQNDLNITWNYEPGEFYSLIMFDPEAVGGNLTHWLRVNITGSNFEDVLSYIPPNPPNKIHHYHVELYAQSEEMEFEGFTRQNSAAAIEKLGFERISEFMFRVAPKNPETSGNRGPPSEQQEKYCRCINKVAAKGGSYNPYRVCAHSVGTTYRGCTKDVYDFGIMSLAELQGYAKRHNLTIKQDADAQQRIIEDFLSKKK